MAAPAPRPRQNTHRIPSTVNPRDMVQISGGVDSDNDGPALSNDDSDQEYVQSEAEDEPALSADNPRAREPRRGGTAARSSRSQALRSHHNFIDRREDDEEGEYVNDSSGDEPEVKAALSNHVSKQPKPSRMQRLMECTCCRLAQILMGRWLRCLRRGDELGATAHRKSETMLCCAARAPVRSLQHRPRGRTRGVAAPNLLYGTQQGKRRTRLLSNPVQCGGQTRAMLGCRSALHQLHTMFHRSPFQTPLTSCSTLAAAAMQILGSVLVDFCSECES